MASAQVVESVLDLVGHTPLIRLRRVVDEGAATVWGKAEQFNPGGSVKDRVALAMIEAAERDGRLRPGQLVVEPTSGNTGIGLALACAVKGYKLALAMPESMSLERRALLEAYGAEIILTPAERVMEGAIEAAEELVEQRGAFMPMQFSNPANPARHAETTARELLERFADTSLDAFVAAVGTGGTVSGVGRVLRAERPGTRIVAVEPAQSPVLSGGEPGPTKIQGIGAGFVPDNFDASVVDEIRTIGDREAYAMKDRLAREEGLLVGISAGANVVAALAVARELGPGKNVVCILCDTGERYFSLDTYFRSSPA
jgi:cysteine synthase A